MEFKRQIGEFGEVRAMPRPSQHELDAFYEKTYYGEGVTTTYSAEYDADELSQKKLRAECTIEAVVQNIPGSPSEAEILEVGCGEGFVLSAAKARGLKIEGVDYQAMPVERFNPNCLDQMHAEAPASFLENVIETGRTYDVVILQNVLEHVRDPENLLSSIKSALKSGGLLLVQVPNDFSRMQALAMQQGRTEKETWFAPPQHLTYFNTENLGPYLDSHGFEIVDGFMDFPIETFLWGAPTNYTKDRSFGPHAHRGRVELDLFFSRNGLKPYLDFYRACYGVGFGRNIAVIAKVK
jgi:2-polyprenyl-3-methyl-5-hydroxy-6-metoxy-1,4-benzoquinol methylase